MNDTARNIASAGGVIRPFWLDPVVAG